MLLKTPFVTAVAVMSLALGIGANSAIYSLFDQMLLRPLPVPDPVALINLGAPGPKPGQTQCSQAGSCEVVFSYPMFRDLERTQTVLTGLAAHRTFGPSLSIDGEPMTGQGVMVSGSYFPTLQLQPAAGRLLAPTDDAVIGANFVVVLGYEFWRDTFGESPGAIGKTIRINGKTFTVIGVAPQGFSGTTLGTQPSVYVPISMRAELEVGFKNFDNRRSYWMYVFGRRKPGVTIAQATVALNALYRPILNDVEVPLQENMSAQTLTQFRAKTLTVEDGRRGQSSIHREAKSPLYLLMGVTLVVLLIACANIANLLLARGAGRSAEMGVRLALGASRKQLLSLLLTESILLAAIGGVVSLIVAKLTLSFIASMMPADAAGTIVFALEPQVIVFTAALALVTGVIFGLFPAMHSTRADLIGVIRAGAGQLTGGKAAARFRATLVTVQIALSMALLVSAGLFLKSLRNVSRVDLGMNLNDLATFRVSPVRAGMDTIRAAIYLARVEQELKAIPGVTGVTASRVPLLSGESWGSGVQVQGFASGPDVDNDSRFNQVGPGYFTMLGVPMRAGRDIAESDEFGGAKVAVVNEAFAKKFNLGRDAVGKFMVDGGPTDTLNVQIVGVVPDMKYSDVKDTVPPVFYYAARQDHGIGALHYYVRSSLPTAQLMAAIPGVRKKLDPTIPVEDLKSMPQQIRENVFLDRMISILSAAFAIIATLLAGIGLYGMLAFSVAQRTREIGVRMALGANSARVRRMVMKQVGLMTAIGAVVGVSAAFGIGKAARALLFGLEGYDASVFSLSVVSLAIVALAAGFIPARRAALVDPMQALRHD
ncbi:MAG: ABC transporter permease [Gemmatimonadaceae bacterium]|nr:ABC transporter permease [Gemmatimonadaceae bacterium]